MESAAERVRGFLASAQSAVGDRIVGRLGGEKNLSTGALECDVPGRLAASPLLEHPEAQRQLAALGCSQVSSRRRRRVQPNPLPPFRVEALDTILSLSRCLGAEGAVYLR
jgi:hypothetical protein